MKPFSVKYKYIREGQTSYGKIAFNIDGRFVRDKPHMALSSIILIVVSLEEGN